MCLHTINLYFSEAEGPIELDVEPQSAKPEYTSTELANFVSAIKKMVILKHIREADWHIDCENIIHMWLTNTDHLMLSFYLSHDKRHIMAILPFPNEKVVDVFYFSREPNQIFTLDGFHDEVIFGRTYDIDRQMLITIEHLYAPILFTSLNGSESVQAKFKKSIYEFLAKITDYHYKKSGYIVLYIPSEIQNVDDVEASNDKDLIVRLEYIVDYWIGQLKSALSDNEQIAPYFLLSPEDELNFWKYRGNTIQHKIYN